MHCLRNFLECFSIGDCIIALQFEWLALTFQELLKEILESLMSSTESTNQTTVTTWVSLGALPVTQSLECFKPSPSTEWVSALSKSNILEDLSNNDHEHKVDFSWHAIVESIVSLFESTTGLLLWVTVY